MRTPRPPFLELVLAAWVALWIGMGYLVDREVRGIATLGDTVVLAGGSIEQTAQALDSVRDLPFVGEDVHRLAVNARRTAASAIVNGREARGDVERLATLLWFVVAAAPTLPALAFYAWSRRPGGRR